MRPTSEKSIYKMIHNIKITPLLLCYFVVFGFCLLILSSCKEASHFQLLQVKGNVVVYNYSKTLYLCTVKADSLHPTALMASPNDLIIFLDPNDLVCVNTKESFQNISFRKSIGYVNGKINCINIVKDDQLLPWLMQMKAADIADLKALCISVEIPENYYPYLKEIAKIKPGIGLFFQNNVKFKALVKLFTPTFISGITLNRSDLDVLPNLKNLQLLVLSETDTLLIDPLPRLSQLKQLIIPFSDHTKIDKSTLLNNQQIESLSIIGNVDDVSFIRCLRDLKQLNLIGVKSLSTGKGVTFLSQFEQLESLTLVGEKFDKLNTVNELHHLNRLSLLTSVSQSDFESILGHQKDLEILEIRVDSAISLQPVLQLKNLVGLVVENAESIDPVISSLKNLKYLSISKKVFERDGVNIENLKKVLPQCTIVPNEGFCLGSGWLLLMLPVIVLFRVCLPRKRT